MAADGTDPASRGIGALLPAEIARKAETIGAAKIRMDFAGLFVLAVLAGAFIALGAMFATTVLAGAEGVLLAGLAFCLGLILVVAGGAELFTGNTLMVMAWAAGAIRLAEMLRAWAIVFLGNLLGALGTAALMLLSGQYLSGDGAVAGVAMRLALDKATQPFDRAFFLGVLCNVLVCLAVWPALGARTTSDKVLAVLFPVSAFVAAGYEHSVANMYLIPLGLLIKAAAPPELWLQLAVAEAELLALTWLSFVWRLIPVTLGNILGGGGVLVGGVYWFIYLRPRRPGNS